MSREWETLSTTFAPCQFACSFACVPHLRKGPSLGEEQRGQGEEHAGGPDAEEDDAGATLGHARLQRANDGDIPGTQGIETSTIVQEDGHGRLVILYYRLGLNLHAAMMAKKILSSLCEILSKSEHLTNLEKALRSCVLPTAVIMSCVS